LKVAAI